MGSGEWRENEKRIPHRRSPKTGDRVPFGCAQSRRDDKLEKGPTADGAPLRGLREPYFERRGRPSRLHLSMYSR